MSDQELLVEIRKALNVNPDCHCDCADCEEYREHKQKFDGGFIRIPVDIDTSQVTWAGTTRGTTAATRTFTGGWTTSATTTASGGMCTPLNSNVTFTPINLQVGDELTITTDLTISNDYNFATWADEENKRHGG